MVYRKMNIYTLEIFITSGPVTKKFVKKNPIVSRTIEIQGNQSLEELHNAIFEAFDREDEHLYQFQFGGKSPNDPQSRRYGLAIDNNLEELELEGDVTKTTLDALKLKKDEVFGYLFDFGDDWWHQVNVIAIENISSKSKYPKITNRVGQSPPQYVDIDE